MQGCVLVSNATHFQGLYFTLQGAAPGGDVTCAKHRAEHLAPLAIALFRVSIWAKPDAVSQLVTAYLDVLGLDAAAQDELSEATHADLTKKVCRFSLVS